MTLHRFYLFLPILVCLSACEAREPMDDDDDSSVGPESDRVSVLTSLGEFEVEFYGDAAPITTANFLAYVDEGFFDGDDGLGATVFHRVIDDFVIQGGGMTEEGTEKQTHSAIINEAATSGLSNLRGTLSMARTNAPHSATSQFFVNLVDNLFLDPGESTPDGYAVFGEVIAGMDVVDAIGGVSTDSGDQPIAPVVIEDVERL
ncbi:MAG: peptidylprolyl isomerase [Myxococcota bacterium]|nr:peptidylprolyl isomerase [Myxococcota bacterium]